MANDWPIPADLTPLGKQAAERIHKFLVDKDLTEHGGGGKFYSPTEWQDRGEEYGLSGLLIVVHDGGAHAGAFNLDYEQYDLNEELQSALKDIGVWTEQCTSWYSAVYKF